MSRHTNEPLYVIATLVDPWYRGKLMSATLLDAAMQRLVKLSEGIQQQVAAVTSAQEESSVKQRRQTRQTTASGSVSSGPAGR